MNKKIIKNLAKKEIVGQHHALGTIVTLRIYGIQTKSLLQKSFTLIDYYENLLTVNRDESEIMDINHAAGKNKVQVTSSTYSLVKLAVKKS